MCEQRFLYGIAFNIYKVVRVTCQSRRCLRRRKQTKYATDMKNDEVPFFSVCPFPIIGKFSVAVHSRHVICTWIFSGTATPTTFFRQVWQKFPLPNFFAAICFQTLSVTSNVRLLGASNTSRRLGASRNGLFSQAKLRVAPKIFQDLLGSAHLLNAKVQMTAANENTFHASTKKSYPCPLILL